MQIMIVDFQLKLINHEHHREEAQAKLLGLIYEGKHTEVTRI